MENLQNLHTHSTFCDGVDTPEQMVNIAISKGFSGIGFSGHSYMYYSKGHCMSLEGTEQYKAEVLRLKQKYSGQIDVFLGLEFDMYSEIDLSGYEYLIGDVHYLKIGSEYVGFDRKAEVVKSVIEDYFDGDGMKFALRYYEEFSKLPQYGNFDIIGHYDLITKNIDIMPLFDAHCDEYYKAAFEAMDALRGKIPFFEINTGAIARGYRTTPYPSIPLLRKFREMGFGAVITSDCHDGKYLDMAFEDCRKMLIECGFNERYILTNKGFCSVAV